MGIAQVLKMLSEKQMNQGISDKETADRARLARAICYAIDKIPGAIKISDYIGVFDSTDQEEIIRVMRELTRPPDKLIAMFGIDKSFFEEK